MEIRPFVFTDKFFSRWFLGGAVFVFILVMVGGITRLTGSGLSIVQWKPVTGIIPPLSQSSWECEFYEYQSSPEFKKINTHFSLSDFKKIYAWEYLHRLLARMVGFYFFIPLIWGVLKQKFVSAFYIKRLLLMSLLVAVQGFAGWYMVKSGLSIDPHVSHFRLSIHLLLAAITFLSSLYFSWEKKWVSHVHFGWFHSMYMLILLLQVMAGAWVAGTHGGRICTTFPDICGSFIPQVFHDYSFIEAITKQPIGIQFLHRVLAGVLVIIAPIFLIWLKKGNYYTVGLRVYFLSLSMQVLLGIITLILGAPWIAGLFHQLLAFYLLGSTWYLRFEKIPE